MNKKLSRIILICLTLSYLTKPTFTFAHALFMINEGFWKHALVKKPNGYVPIQHLTKNDVITGLDKNGQICEQEVWNNQKLWVDSYVKIYSGENKFILATHQKLYLPEEEMWILAHDATPGQQLAPNFTIDSVEIINKKIEVYALTTSLHHFQVTKYDVIAHNMNAAATAASILIGRIIAYCPVSTILGAIVSLATAGIHYNPVDNVATDIPQRKTPEAIYYDRKRQELEFLRDSFIKVIHDIKNFSNLKNPFYFTYNYFRSIKPHISKVIIKESQFNAKQLEALQPARDAHLLNLEQEIFELHIMLCSHLNELIDQRGAALSQLDQTIAVLEEIKDRYYGPSPEDAQLYCTHMSQLEKAIEDLEQCNEELQRIHQYYLNSEHADIVKKCSNISSVLDEECTKIAKQAASIKKTKIELQRFNRQVNRAYAEQNISIKGFQKKLKEKNRKASKAELNKRVKDAKIRLTKIKAPEIDRKVQNSAEGDCSVAAAGGGGGRPPEDPWNNDNQCGNWHDDLPEDEPPNDQKQQDIEEEKLREERFRKSVENGTTENNLKHFFDKVQHGFHNLLNKIGGIKNREIQKQLVSLTIKKLYQHPNLPKEGIFEDIFVQVLGERICTRGRVMNGIIKLGTMYIPQ